MNFDDLFTDVKETLLSSPSFESIADFGEQEPVKGRVFELSAAFNYVAETFRQLYDEKQAREARIGAVAESQNAILPLDMFETYASNRELDEQFAKMHQGADRNDLGLGIADSPEQIVQGMEVLSTAVKQDDDAVANARRAVEHARDSYLTLEDDKIAPKQVIGSTTRTQPTAPVSQQIAPKTEADTPAVADARQKLAEIYAAHNDQFAQAA